LQHQVAASGYSIGYNIGCNIISRLSAREYAFCYLPLFILDTLIVIMDSAATRKAEDYPSEYPSHQAPMLTMHSAALTMHSSIRRLPV
jgi:hypothetical protein